MELALVALLALLASVVTLFSGFGLGTVLLPVFALLFPVPLAIAATAIVHMANNLFRLALLGREANWRVVLHFGVPAAVAALGGAALLGVFDRMPALLTYSLAGRPCEVTLVKAVIGALIVAFAALEMSPRVQALALPQRWMPLGGTLSGFFGGLAGMQGALRSAFLLKAGLGKEAFVATSVVSAVAVDATRLLVYGQGQVVDGLGRAPDILLPVACATACACAGSLVGKRLLGSVTLQGVRHVVVIVMTVVGIALMAGIL